MKKRHLVYAIALIVGMGACAASAKKQAEAKPDVWKSYNVGTVLFEDKASETKRFRHLSPDHSGCGVLYQRAGTHCIGYSL